jgi:hypothetical protein
LGSVVRPCITGLLTEPHPNPPTRPPDDVEDVHGIRVARVVLGVEEDEAVGASGEKGLKPRFEVLPPHRLAVQAQAASLVERNGRWL